MSLAAWFNLLTPLLILVPVSTRPIESSARAAAVEPRSDGVVLVWGGTGAAPLLLQMARVRRTRGHRPRFPTWLHCRLRGGVPPQHPRYRDIVAPPGMYDISLFLFAYHLAIWLPFPLCLPLSNRHEAAIGAAPEG
jgi:hypothetical protein